MRRFRTLRGRLTAFAVLAAALAVGLLVIAFNLVLGASLDRDANSRLRSRAAAAATTVETERGRVQVRESAADEAIDSQVWVFQGNRAVVRANAPAAVQRAVTSLAGGPRRFADVPGRDARLYTLPLTDDGRRLGTVVVGLSLEAYDRTSDIALLASAVLAAILLGAVYGVTWLTIGRALRPVTAMTRSAAMWSEDEGDRRFGTEPRPDELGELAATFDALLDRVSASLRHEQRLSAELSHELRTPLARITAEVELLQRRERSPEARGEAYERLGRSADQMSRILETLMAAARAEGQSQPGRSLLGQALEGLAAEWDGPLSERGVRLSVASEREDVTVGVDAELVERIVAPLLDNAGRHANAEVSVEAARHDGRVRLTVRDDGPGLSPGEEERIFEPGVSGARANGHTGAGLGLALARRLARAVGGEVSAESDGRPGAAFEVDLPG
jgi:two-component system heavy metal sensor histidine kinase CusS